jgi:nucleoside diphosphate kinase
MGATDSSQATPGTIRHGFGNHAILCENAVHGSDSPSAAIAEARHFFC